MTPDQDRAGVLDAVSFGTNCEASYDAVIAGSGAGGAVVAKELAEGGMKVAILEEGGSPVRHRDLAMDAVGRMYRDSGMVGARGRPYIPIPLGKCFGGSTVVNSGTCFRTPEAVLDLWRDCLGLRELYPETLERSFARVEAELQVETADFAVMSRPNTLVHELCERAGRPGAPLRRNAVQCAGCGMCCYGCTSGAKRGMDLSYLPKALRAGADAYVHARAVRILTDAKGAASGVLAESVDSDSRRLGPRILLRAPRVIVAGGTLLTPLLLRSSGIGRGNRHLGRHLIIHPASKVVGEFSERIDSWAGIPQGYYLDALHDDGITFEGAAMPPDVGCVTVPFLGRRLAQYIKRYAYLASFGFMVRDTAEGRLVRVPFAGFRYRYSLSGTDARRMQRAIAFLSRLFLEGGAIRVYVMINEPENEFSSIGEVERFERRPLDPANIAAMGFHPLGTCRMAATPEAGVCDVHQQVFGAPGVYVCDGSVVPTPLNVNPQETIMALATRLAEHLLGRELPPSAS